MNERKAVKVREELPLRNGNAEKIILKVEYTNCTSLGSGYLMRSIWVKWMAHAGIHYVTFVELSYDVGTVPEDLPEYLRKSSLNCSIVKVVS